MRRVEVRVLQVLIFAYSAVSAYNKLRKLNQKNSSFSINPTPFSALPCVVCISAIVCAGE
jgi:hypothetical protein